MSRVLFDLPADICHIHPEYLVVSTRIRSPHSADYLLVGEHRSGALSQHCHKLEFVLSKLRVPVIYVNPELIIIYYKSAYLKSVLYRNVGVNSDAAGMPQSYPYPCEKLIRGSDRLHQIIVCSLIQRVALAA